MIEQSLGDDGDTKLVVELGRLVEVLKQLKCLGQLTMTLRSLTDIVLVMVNFRRLPCSLTCRIRFDLREPSALARLP